ncbi:thermonuclease family protein [Hugenholtzia roseola]|uniref:thermonuclease family protein n=1 Tax=Hugenholtzia roseola TaxID=1002 RepID=UPI0004058E14|nr:thermonuclease family protein [Hugenholtzia roseola]
MRVLVLKVLDGDTFVVQYHNLPITIRLANIDVPELRTDFGKKVQRYLSDLILSQEVEIQVFKKDTYGRYLAEVHFKNESLDEKLVSEGLAWHWEKYSLKPELTNLERFAQDQKMGIWSEEFKEVHYTLRHPQSKEHLDL